MKRRSFIVAAALVALLGFAPRAAHAQDNTWSLSNLINLLGHNQDPRLFYLGVGVGAATTVGGYYLTKKYGSPAHAPVTDLGAYGITTGACIVAYPFLGTIILNRPLTPREAYIGMAECIVPFIGGWFVDTYLPHTAFYDGTPPAPPPRKVAHHHK
jgi:hypothetical protein